MSAAPRGVALAQTTSACRPMLPDMIPRPTHRHGIRRTRMPTRMIQRGRHQNMMATMRVIILAKVKRHLATTSMSQQARKDIPGCRRRMKETKATGQGSKTIIRSGSRHDHSCAVILATPHPGFTSRLIAIRQIPAYVSRYDIDNRFLLFLFLIQLGAVRTISL